MRFSDLLEEEKLDEWFINRDKIINQFTEISRDLIGKKIKFKIKLNKEKIGIGNIADVEDSYYEKVLKIIMPNGGIEFFNITPSTKFQLLPI